MQVVLQYCNEVTEFRKLTRFIQVNFLGVLPSFSFSIKFNYVTVLINNHVQLLGWSTHGKFDLDQVKVFPCIKNRFVCCNLLFFAYFVCDLCFSHTIIAWLSISFSQCIIQMMIEQKFVLCYILYQGKTAKYFQKNHGLLLVLDLEI